MESSKVKCRFCKQDKSSLEVKQVKNKAQLGLPIMCLIKSITDVSLEALEYLWEKSTVEISRFDQDTQFPLCYLCVGLYNELCNNYIVYRSVENRLDETVKKIQNNSVRIQISSQPQVEVKAEEEQQIYIQNILSPSRIEVEESAKDPLAETEGGQGVQVEDLTDGNTVKGIIILKEAPKIKANKWICKICPEDSENYKLIRLDHIIKHEQDAKPEEKTLNCLLCGKQFLTKFMLDRHERSHKLDDTKVYSCELCEKRFMYEDNLDYHMYSEHKKFREKWKCGGCDESFDSISDWKIHGLKFHPNLFSCPMCGYKCPLEPLHQAHLNIHKQVGPYQCTFCLVIYKRKYVFATAIDLANHIKTHISSDWYRRSRKRPRPMGAGVDKTNSTNATTTTPSVSVTTSSDSNFSGTTKKSLKEKLSSQKHEVTIGDINNTPFLMAPLPEKEKEGIFAVDPVTGKLKCHFCGILYPNKNSLQKHLAHHKNRLKFTCELCPDLDRSIENTEANKLKHSMKHEQSSTIQQKIHSCSKCHKQFATKYMHNRHEKLHGEDKVKPLSCNLCEYRCSSLILLRNHAAAHYGEGNVPQISCKVCTKEFSTDNTLRRHELSQHKKEIFTHECKRCYIRYPTEDILETHLNTHKKNGPYQCKYCFTTFNGWCFFETASELSEHLTIHGDCQVKLSPPKKKILQMVKCSECNKMISSKNNLKAHMVAFHKEKNIECSLCWKKFSNRNYRSGLNAHMKKAHSSIETPEPELPYDFVCQICGKSFQKNSNLVKHNALVHERKYMKSCNVCSKSFTTKPRLDLHVKIYHDQVRDQLCYFCGKKFSRWEGLKYHLLLHLNEKPIPCSYSFCKKRFLSQVLRQAHEKRNHKKGLEGPKINFRSKAKVTKPKSSMKGREILNRENPSVPIPNNVVVVQSGNTYQNSFNTTLDFGDLMDI